MKKNIIFTLLTTVALIFTSCTKDEDGVVNATDSNIIGAWNLTAFETTNGRIEITADGQTIVSELDIVGKDYDAIVTFAEEPKMVTSEGSFNATITTTTFGISETEEAEGENFFENSPWSLEDGILTIGSGIEAQDFTITTLTDSRMDLSYTLEESEEILGFTYSTTVTYTITLSK